MNGHDLKPCPFCGSGNVRLVEFLDGEGDRVFAVGCEGCGCNGTPHIPLMDDARPAAIASWQRRALSPAPEGQVLVPVELLRVIAGCAYPVSTDVDPRGYAWSEAYLDQALPIIKLALSAPRQELP